MAQVNNVSKTWSHSHVSHVHATAGDHTMGSPGSHPREKKTILLEFWERAAWVVARSQNGRQRWDFLFSQASGTEALSVAQHLVNVVVCLPTRDAS
jgi:hypothetical protein